MFDYIYGNEGEQFSFYRIPKLLFTSDVFNRMSAESKILYGILLDRVSVSLKNGWIDEGGKVYIICTVDEIMDDLHCGKNKAIQLMAELENPVGLIEKRRQGLGRPNLIYVKNFLSTDVISRDIKGIGMEDNCGDKPAEANFKKFKNQTSGGLKNKPLEVSKSNPSNINMNKTDKNETDNHIISSGGDEGKRVLCVREQTEAYFREVLGMDQMRIRHPYDSDMLEGILSILVDTCCMARPTIRICGEDKPASVVKSRLMKLDVTHLEYVLDTLVNCSGDIRNMKQYILTLLYNAPATIDAYYRTMLNRDYNKLDDNSS